VRRTIRRFECGPDKQVPQGNPRRGTLVVPVETQNMIQHCTADVTSTSLRKECGRDKHVPPKAKLPSRFSREIARRGTLVVPAETQNMLQHCTADVTSTSLRKECGRDKHVPPKAKLTSRFRKEIPRRGTLVVPAETHVDVRTPVGRGKMGKSRFHPGYQVHRLIETQDNQTISRTGNVLNSRCVKPC